jgi:hypothetical protein
METTKNILTPEQRNFFDRLRNYIDKPIYFYGSIQRDDYFPGKSDFDIDIFTDNESSTIYALCNFLNLKKSDFKKSVYKVKNTIIYGYKVKYTDEASNVKMEMGLYNEKFKSIIMKDHLKDFYLPFYISIILVFIKFLFYKLQIISKETYKRLKRLIMNDNDELKFIVVDIK